MMTEAQTGKMRALKKEGEATSQGMRQLLGVANARRQNSSLQPPEGTYSAGTLTLAQRN